MSLAGETGIDLSVVIVSWNTRQLLADCLASVPEACADLSVEVFVVDNDSSDGSAEMVATDFPQVRLLRSGGNLGFTAGNNLALPATSGHWILLLNPDTVCPPGSLARLVHFAATREPEEELGAVGPRLIDANGSPVISFGWFPSLRFHWLEFLDPLRLLPGSWCRDRVVHTPSREEASHPVEYVMGACLLMPRAAYDEIGPLDERFFMYFEETDWCLRARQTGRRNWFCGEVEVAHLEGKSSGQVSDFSLRQFQLSYRRFLAKHHGPAMVLAFRIAQAFEYGAKFLFRRFRPGERNRDLAAAYGTRFRLQFQSRIQANPPH